MRRREFIAILGNAVASSFAAQAQPAAAGEKFLARRPLEQWPAASGGATSWRGEVLDVLARNGFSEGRSLELVERYSGGDAARLPALAREINAVGVDAIVAVTLQSARVALAATQATPVVMVIGYDPVAEGIIASLARPGARVTGIYFQTAEGDVKRLELLREAIPGARRPGYLGMSYERARAVELMASAAARLGIELAMHWVDGPAEYASAFAAMRNEGAAGAVVAANQPLASFASRVAASAAEPTADDMRVGLHGPRRLRPRLRPRSYLWTAPRRRIRRPYPQGSRSLRAAGGTVRCLEVDRQSARCRTGGPHHPAVPPRPGRRGDRMKSCSFSCGP